MVRGISDIADVVVGEQHVSQSLMVRTEGECLDCVRIICGQLIDSGFGICHLVGL